MAVHRLFEVHDARALLPEVRRRVDALIEGRADLSELSMDLRSCGSSALGGLAEAKALQARLDDMLEWFPDQGIELKGFAPLLIDFPAELAGVSVRLCWLEGEPTWLGTTAPTSASPAAADSPTDYR